MQIPESLDFLNIDGLSNELRQKLDHHRPDSLASRENSRHDTGGAIDIASTRKSKKRGSRFLNARSDRLSEDASALGVSLNSSQASKLVAYGGLIEKWNRSINLVSRGDIARLDKRHLTDSLAASPYLKEKPPSMWVRVPACPAYPWRSLGQP